MGTGAVEAVVLAAIATTGMARKTTASPRSVNTPTSPAPRETRARRPRSHASTKTHNLSGDGENEEGDSNRHHDTAGVADTALVASGNEDDDGPANPAPAQLPVDAASEGNAASHEEAAHGCAAIVRQVLSEQGLSSDVIDVIGRSWRDGTKTQYKGYIAAWTAFSCERQIPELSPSLANVLDFLQKIFTKGLQGQPVGYSTVNTARSALSTFIMIGGIPVGQHPVVRRYLKGVFNIVPALPRYECTGNWDVNVVLDYLYSLGINSKLTLQMLTYKLVMLLCLLSGQRSQSIYMFDVRNMTLGPKASRAEFLIANVTKTSRPGQHNGTFEYVAFPANRRLCVVTVLIHYLERTLDARQGTKALLLTHSKPHGAASSDSIRRWVKKCLELAGIDTNIFKPHSVRGASTSFAARMNVSLDLIMRSAGWQRQSTFSKYYNFDVKANFGTKILEAYMAQK